MYANGKTFFECRDELRKIVDAAATAQEAFEARAEYLRANPEYAEQAEMRWEKQAHDMTYGR